MFLIVGIAGFIPGITTNYDELSFAGNDGAKLLALFEVNIIHLLFAIGIPMAATAAMARGYLVGGGVAYLGVLLFGLLVDHDSAANFIAVNTADNWLHPGLGVGMIVLGAVLPRSVRRDAAGSPGAQRA